MKHIAFLIGDLSHVGGLERVTIALSESLAKKGYVISLISMGYFDKPYFEIEKSINIYSIQKDGYDSDISLGGNIPHRLKAHSLILLRLNKLIKQNKIDILISTEMGYCKYFPLLKKLNKKLKLVAWEHFNYSMKKWLPWVKGREYAKKHADAIVVLTRQDEELYLESGFVKAPIFVRNNFMNKYPNDSAELKLKNVLAIGRYDKQKGFDILVDIWEKVKQNSIANGWVLQIVGDGDEKENIKNLVSEKNLKDSVILIDATPNVAQYYLDASIYVMTSRYEGFGLVLMEAESYGVPTISFDCIAGPREIINDGQDGFLIPMGDNDEMAKKILELMSDEELRISMGKKAKENAARFKKEKIVDQWVSLLEEL